MWRHIHIYYGVDWRRNSQLFPLCFFKLRVWKDPPNNSCCRQSILSVSGAFTSCWGETPNTYISHHAWSSKTHTPARSQFDRTPTCTSATSQDGVVHLKILAMEQSFLCYLSNSPRGLQTAGEVLCATWLEVQSGRSLNSRTVLSGGVTNKGTGLEACEVGLRFYGWNGSERVRERKQSTTTEVNPVISSGLLMVELGVRWHKLLHQACSQGKGSGWISETAGEN